jgi:hypothetical protein
VTLDGLATQDSASNDLELHLAIRVHGIGDGGSVGSGAGGRLKGLRSLTLLLTLNSSSLNPPGNLTRDQQR